MKEMVLDSSCSPSLLDYDAELQRVWQCTGSAHDLGAGMGLQMQFRQVVCSLHSCRARCVVKIFWPLFLAPPETQSNSI